MIRTRLLIILPLVVAVTVGQGNRGTGYYGSSNVRDQRPSDQKPMYRLRALPLPGRPLPVARSAIPPSPVISTTSAAPAAPAAARIPEASVVAPSPAAVTALPSVAPAAPTYAPVLRPNLGLRPPYTPGYGRPPLMRPAPTLGVVSPSQPSVAADPQPPVASAPPVVAFSQPPVVAPQPEPIPQPEPALQLQEEPVPQLESITEVVPRPEQEPIPIPAPVAPSQIRPLLPKPEPIREPVFGGRPLLSTSPVIYYPTPSYEPTIASEAPPATVTIQLNPSVTTPAETLELNFQCKEGNGYYPVENECDTYIECKADKAIKLLCPDGLHFNPAVKDFQYPCAYPSEVKCAAGAQKQNPKPTEHCPKQYGFYSINDGDCSKFIMCQEGLATIMDCPNGLVFNPETNTCDWPAYVPQCNPNAFKDFTCPEAPVDGRGVVSGIIYKYRYGAQCKLYVACQRGHPRLLSCERGLSFDEKTQSCVNEDNVTDCATPYTA